MNVNFLASVLCLTQQCMAQVCVPESLKDFTHHEYYEKLWGEFPNMSGGNNVISFLLLIQLICLSDKYLCLISNMIESGFNFQLLAPVQLCSSGLKHILTPHVLVLHIFTCCSAPLGCPNPSPWSLLSPCFV